MKPIIHSPRNSKGRTCAHCGEYHLFGQFPDECYNSRWRSPKWLARLDAAVAQINSGLSVREVSVKTGIATGTLYSYIRENRPTTTLRLREVIRASEGR